MLSGCDVAESLTHVRHFCNAMNCSLPGSSVHGIFQARILEWVAISFSRESSRPRDWTHVSCIGRWILYPWVPGKPCMWCGPSKNPGHQRLRWAPLVGNTLHTLQTDVLEENGSFVFRTFRLCPKSRPLASSDLQPFIAIQLQWWTEHERGKLPSSESFPQTLKPESGSGDLLGWPPSGQLKWQHPWGLAHPQPSWAGAQKSRKGSCREKAAITKQRALRYPRTTPASSRLLARCPSFLRRKRAGRENPGIYHLASISR